MKTKSTIRLGRDDKILNGIIFVLMALWLIAVCYPLLFVLSCSFSSGSAITNGKVLLFPVEPTLDGYKIILRISRSGSAMRTHSSSRSSAHCST